MEIKAPDRIISSHELKEEFEKIEPQKTFKTGLYYLDKMSMGFKEGDLVIVSGETGHGKTALAITLAKRYIDQGIFPLIFSYEISNQELFERFGEKVPLFYLPRSISSSPDPTKWIETKIFEAKKLTDIKVVFVDHLHYLVDNYTIRTKNTAEMLSYMSREFKHIARRQRVVIFLMAHARRTTGRPTINDIKDSSGVAQESDAVMIIKRNAKRSRKDAQDDEEFEIDTKATLYLDKVRRMGGRTGKIAMDFDGRFYDEI